MAIKVDQAVLELVAERLYQRLFLLRDAWSLGDHLGIELDEGALIVGDRIVDEDGLDGTLTAAGTAVGAGVGIDVEHLISFVKTVAGANYHAVGVLTAKTSFANDVSHRANLR